MSAVNKKIKYRLDKNALPVFMLKSSIATKRRPATIRVDHMLLSIWFRF
jgi:hypothetical protein